MLSRAAVASLVNALLLLTLSLYLQAVAFEISYLGWALMFSLPLGLSVMRGSLGTTRLEYPNATFGVLMLWNMTVGPWFIIDAPDLTLGIVYTESAALVGRMLFLLWCFVFVIAAGRRLGGQARVRPRTVDVVSLCVPIALALAYQLIQGRFTNYQANDISGDAPDTALVIAMGLGKNTLVWLPGFFLLTSMHGQSARLQWISRILAFATVPLLLLTGGRSSIAFAVASGFLFARLSGVRFRLGVSMAVAAVVPACFLLVYTYRTALLETSLEQASLGDLTSIASSSATNLASRDDRRDQAILDFSENMRVRRAPDRSSTRSSTRGSREARRWKARSPPV
jgi:hypothetical protein